MSSPVALPGQSESALVPEKPRTEAIFDRCFIALVVSVIAYGICEAIARWRWWAVAVWIGTSLAIPFAIVAGQKVVEFLDREDY